MPCGDLSDELGARCGPTRHGFLWIGLKDPTDAEFALVNDELKLHPLAVEDAVKGNQRAKLELYDDIDVRRAEDAALRRGRRRDIETGEVMLFVGDRFVVTVRHGRGQPARRRAASAWSSNAEHAPPTARSRSCTR